MRLQIVHNRTNKIIRVIFKGAAISLVVRGHDNLRLIKALSSGGVYKKNNQRVKVEKITRHVVIERDNSSLEFALNQQQFEQMKTALLYLHPGVYDLC